MGRIFPSGEESNDGDDNVTGTEDADQLNGGARNDILDGLGGEDVLNGESGNDTVKGGAGSDSIFGGRDDDQLFGGTLNDTIRDDEGDNVINGEDGNDIITARGTGLIDAGAGNDVVKIGAFNTIDFAFFVKQGGLVGGAGFDTLEIYGSVQFNTFLFNASAAGFERIKVVRPFDCNDDGNTLDFSGVDNDGFRGLDIDGHGGSDILTGTNDRRALFGDILVGAAGADTLNGGDGGDFLFGGPGNDVVNGGDGNDEISGSDAFDAPREHDILNGDDGNDHIFVHSSADVDGGSGIDAIVLKSGTVVSNTSLQGGDGTDTLQIEGAIFAVTNFLFDARGFERLLALGIITGNAWSNSLDFSTAYVTGPLPVRFSGGDGHDSIEATQRSDVVHGDEGNDSLYGNASNDELFGDFGNDVLDGGIGNDKLDGGSGNDVLLGGDGHDDITDTGEINANGGNGNDFFNLTGHVKSGKVQGGGGTDTLLAAGSLVVERIDTSAQLIEFVGGTFMGSDAANTLDFLGVKKAAGQAFNVFGANGADTIKSDIIGALLKGEGNNDTIVSTGANSVVNGGANDDKVTVLGSDSTVFGEDGDDTIASGEGTQKIDAGLGTDTLDVGAFTGGATIDLGRTTAQSTSHGAYTLSGVENLDGTRFGDTIRGSNANNVIHCEDGDDFTYCSLGDDLSDGGRGLDWVSAAPSAVSVTIDLSSTTAQNTGMGMDTFLNFENAEGSSRGDVLTGSRFNNILKAGAGIDFVNALAGNDQIIGGAHQDHLDGGTGRNTFVYLATTDSLPSSVARDQISHFQRLYDCLDMSAIDAILSTAGVDDEFECIGSDLFTAEGQARWEQDDEDTVIEFNVSGTTGAEMVVVLIDFAATSFSAANIIN